MLPKLGKSILVCDNIGKLLLAFYGFHASDLIALGVRNVLSLEEAGRNEKLFEIYDQKQTSDNNDSDDSDWGEGWGMDDDEESEEEVEKCEDVPVESSVFTFFLGGSLLESSKDLKFALRKHPFKEALIILCQREADPLALSDVQTDLLQIKNSNDTRVKIEFETFILPCFLDSDVALFPQFDYIFPTPENPTYDENDLENFANALFEFSTLQGYQPVVYSLGDLSDQVGARVHQMKMDKFPQGDENLPRLNAISLVIIDRTLDIASPTRHAPQFSDVLMEAIAQQKLTHLYHTSPNPFDNGCMHCLQIQKKFLEHSEPEPILVFLSKKIERILKKDEAIRIPRFPKQTEPIEKLKAYLSIWANSILLRALFSSFYQLSCTIVSAYILWWEKWNFFHNIEISLHHAEKSSQKQEEVERIRQVLRGSLEEADGPSLNPCAMLLHAFGLGDSKLTAMLDDVSPELQNYCQQTGYYTADFILDACQNVSALQPDHLRVMAPSPSVYFNNDTRFEPLISRLLLRILDGSSFLGELKCHSEQKAKGPSLFDVFGSSQMPRRPDKANTIIFCILGGITNYEIQSVRKMHQYMTTKREQTDKINVVICSTGLTSPLLIVDQILHFALG